MGIFSWIHGAESTAATAATVAVDATATGAIWPRGRAAHAWFLGADGSVGNQTLKSSFHNSTRHPTQGYWAVKNEKCLKHRDLYRELYGPRIGPEHYCVNQNAAKDFQASKGTIPTQKCYDLENNLQNCQEKDAGTKRSNGKVQRPVLSTDPDYPNTVVFLTPEATEAALGMK